MGEPEEEPGALPETLASQCEHSGTADDINRDTDAPQSPNPTNEVAVSEAELGDKGTECLAGEMGAIAEKLALDEEEEVGPVAGDDNPSVKEEKAEAEEGSTLEMGSSVEIGRLTETEALHEAVIAGTEEEVLKEEEDSQIDHEVKIKEGNDELDHEVKIKEGNDDQEEVVAVSDDILPKEEEKVEEEVEFKHETETKEEDFTQTDEEAPHTDQEMVHLEEEEDFTRTDEEAPHKDQEMVHSEANREGADGLQQSEDNDPTQDEEETNMDDDKSMHDDHDDHGGDKAMDEDLTQDEGGDKGMEEDLMQDGGGDKAMDEAAMGVDGDGMDDDGDDDEPPMLPVKKSGGGGRKKKGRPPRVKKGEEELCFICFDGGELVVCDRRGCPKVYHPSCVNRDEAFFRAKGKWNCGWHICSECQKPARLMCYTCTYSLCKACMKGAEFLSVRGNMGFCPSCLSTVTMIERYEKGERDDSMENINFEDKSSWEFLFRDYWLETKEKQSLTLEEILTAKSEQLTPLPPTTQEKGSSDERASSDDSSARHTEAEETSSKRKSRKRLKQPKTSPSPPPTNKRAKKLRKDKNTLAECSEKRAFTRKSKSGGTNWASEELLDFVAHMRDGDRSVISQFDVQALLLEYIKRENLRDPRRKSQIICDRMLENLFGKPRVGHFEMLKLLESHFLEASPTETDDNQGGGVVDPEPDLEPENSEGSAMGTGSEKRRKGKGKGNRVMQGNLDDYAAIDVHNIGLMYLRRNLMEEMVDGELEAFEEKVVGSFVRIRISNSGQQRQDIYRLVQVVGTGRAAEKYKLGKKMTDITLEILNLDKQEFISIDIISNQEFTEEECKRLRQSIKCGFIPRLSVGEVQEKSRVLQAAKVNDWIESEKMRLSHLRDRASETGRRKELRECVEKLQMLNTPEERMRRLREVHEIHADPTMDPDYESAEEVEPEVVKKDQFTRRDSFGRRGTEAISPRKGGSGFSGDNWRGGFSGDNWRGSRRNQNETSTNSLSSPTTPTANRSPHPWSSEREREREREKEREREREREGERQREREREREREKERERNLHTKVSTIDESEKMWHYLDPSGKMQGPFSMVQLRKWNSSGYFPTNLRIWRVTEKQEDSILLTNALDGRFQKEEKKVAASSLYGSGQHRDGGGDKEPQKIEKAVVGHGELKIDLGVAASPVAANSVLISPAFAKAEGGHALDRSTSFNAEGTNQLPGDATHASQVSYPPTEQQTANPSTIQQMPDPSIAAAATSDPNITSNALPPPSVVGPAQQMNTNSDWATAAAAAAMAQQMAATWTPQIPVPQGTANTTWGGMVGPTTGMNMNMNMVGGWGAPNFNMGMPNMNFGWGPQGMQPTATATAAAWVNQFPAWGGVQAAAPNSGSNWGVGPAQQNPVGAGPVQGNGNANVDPVGGGGGDNASNWQQGAGPRAGGGICRFLMSGHCKKGSGCNYYHPPDDKW